MLTRLLATLLTVAGLMGSAAAAEDAQMAKISGMPIKELDAFVATIAGSVGQDTLKMRGSARTGDCLDLTRVANSFALGYEYLAEVGEVAAKRTEKQANLIRAKAVQARVITFAARVRAEEYLAQRCRSYAVPADNADDPRYGTPAKIGNSEYTEAVIEARQAADTNLAIAVAAGISAKCPDTLAARQSISLLLPYLDKLLADTAKRPQVLGPRASRRGLEVSRRQLVAAEDKLRVEFEQKCAAAPKAN